MPTLEILFYIFIGFIFDTFAGIILAYILQQWKDEERIPEKDVDEWMEEQELFE